MKLFNISDIRKFSEKVLECTGKIYAVTEDGKAQDMKDLARYFIESGMADQINGIREINLVIELQSDMIALMNYAAGMHYQRKVA